MKIIADLGKGKLILPDAVYPVSNRIRTLRDGTRKSDEVVRSIPDNLPYDPQPFPKGLWNVTAVEWQKERGFDLRTYGPVKIRTDAWRRVKIWELDRDGDYLRELDAYVMDTGYLLHYSESSTTLGCIRLSSPEDAIAIANVITEAMKQGPVQLEVV
jgi:hypothetical protein